MLNQLFYSRMVVWAEFHELTGRTGSIFLRPIRVQTVSSKEEMNCRQSVMLGFDWKSCWIIIGLISGGERVLSIITWMREHRGRRERGYVTLAFRTSSAAALFLSDIFLHVWINRYLSFHLHRYLYNKHVPFTSPHHTHISLPAQIPFPKFYKKNNTFLPNLCLLSRVMRNSTTFRHPKNPFIPLNTESPSKSVMAFYSASIQSTRKPDQSFRSGRIRSNRLLYYKILNINTSSIKRLFHSKIHDPI